MMDIVSALRMQEKFGIGADAHRAADTIESLREENTALRQICRDAYEVWAGSEGIPDPETATEAYLYQLLIQMRDEVKRGLK